MTTMTASDLQNRVASLEAELATLREKLDYAEAVAGIKRGQKEADEGKGIPLREVDRQMRAKYNIPRA